MYKTRFLTLPFIIFRFIWTCCKKVQLMMSKNLQKGAINDLYGIISAKERHIETTVLIRDLILKLALFLYFWSICRVQVPSSIKLPFFIGIKLASIMYYHERSLNQDFLSRASLKMYLMILQ